MELSFFTAGGCTRIAVFWIWAWTVLITHRRFPCAWTALGKHQDLFFPCSATPASKAGDRKELGGSTASTADQRDTPHLDLVLSSKCWRKGGTFDIAALSSQAILVCAEAWLPRNWPSIWLLMGSIKALSCTTGE